MPGSAAPTTDPRYDPSAGRHAVRTREGAGLIDGEATVKRLRRTDDGHAWLMPHNPAYNPIPADTATILGKVVAVLRNL